MRVTAFRQDFVQDVERSGMLPFGIVSRRTALGSRSWSIAMKRILTLLVLGAFSGLVLAQPDASTPSVDRILDRFVQALGGRAALEKITTMAFTGVMEVQGAKGPGKTAEYFEYPDHFAAIAEIPGYGTVRTVCDGKTAWNVDPKKGVTELSGAQLADMRHRADIHWNLKLRDAASMTSARGGWSRRLAEVRLNEPVDRSVFASGR